MTTVLITGANRGLGFALTREYAREGATVIATCRAPEKAADLKTLAAEFPSIHIEQLDVVSAESRESLARNMGEAPLDILINNAGLLSGANPALSALDNDPSQSFGSLDAESWAKVLWTNTIAPLMITQSLYQPLLRVRERKIVMISSLWGSIAQAEPDHFAYRSSKAALNAAMRCLALDLQKERFVVVSVNPGWVRTKMGGQQANLSPEESAAKLLRVVGTLRPERTGEFFSHTGESLAW